MPRNVLYLAVLPLVHISMHTPFQAYGMTEQTLTLFPDRAFATEFFPDEVDAYISMFQKRANDYLKGGHVTGYEFHKEQAPEGRFVVKVIQHVE